jgi:hypothetical protein
MQYLVLNVSECESHVVVMLICIPCTDTELS